MIRPLFKAVEPFMEVRDGQGFVGVIMYDEIEDKMQCHVCGKFFSSLGAHVNMAHKISMDDYRIKYDLPMSIGLCSKAISKERSDRAIKRDHDGDKTWGSKTWKKGIKHSRKFKRQNKMAFVARENKFGLCQAQMYARYRIVEKIVEHPPSIDELLKYDDRLYTAMRRRQGGINGFRRIHGIAERTAKIMHPAIEIAAILRKKAVEIGRLPKSIDFARGQEVNRDTIYERFGSFRAALSYAGLV